MTPEELGILREMAAEKRSEASAREDAASVWRAGEHSNIRTRELSIAAKCRARAAALESALREIEKLRTICRDRGAMLDAYGDRERGGR